MNFAISDANIFIDLFAIELIEEFFQLNLTLHTTDLVINELELAEQLLLKKHIGLGKLTVKKLEDVELEELRETAIISKKLSKPDISVYAYAMEISAMILTSDRRLRTEAQEKGFEVHGVLWLFEQLIEQEILSKTNAVGKMRELMLVNTWLPKQECLKRIDKWLK